MHGRRLRHSTETGRISAGARPSLERRAARASAAASMLNRRCRSMSRRKKVALARTEGAQGWQVPGRFRKEGSGERGGEGPGRAASTLRFGAARDPRAGLRRLPHRRFPGLQQRASPHAPPPLIVRRLTSHLHCWLRQARAPTSRASAGWSRNTGATATTTATLPSAPTPTVRRPSSKPTRISDTDTGSTMAV